MSDSTAMVLLALAGLNLLVLLAFAMARFMRLAPVPR